MSDLQNPTVLLPKYEPAKIAYDKLTLSDDQGRLFASLENLLGNLPLENSLRQCLVQGKNAVSGLTTKLDNQLSTFQQYQTGYIKIIAALSEYVCRLTEIFGSTTTISSSEANATPTFGANLVVATPILQQLIERLAVLQKITAIQSQPGDQSSAMQTLIQQLSPTESIFIQSLFHVRETPVDAGSLHYLLSASHNNFTDREFRDFLFFLSMDNSQMDTFIDKIRVLKKMFPFTSNRFFIIRLSLYLLRHNAKLSLADLEELFMAPNQDSFFENTESSEVQQDYARLFCDMLLIYAKREYTNKALTLMLQYGLAEKRDSTDRQLPNVIPLEKIRGEISYICITDPYLQAQWYIRNKQYDLATLAMQNRIERTEQTIEDRMKELHDQPLGREAYHQKFQEIFPLLLQQGLDTNSLVNAQYFTGVDPTVIMQNLQHSLFLVEELCGNTNEGTLLHNNIARLKLSTLIEQYMGKDPKKPIKPGISRLEQMQSDETFRRQLTHEFHNEFEIFNDGLKLTGNQKYSYFTQLNLIITHILMADYDAVQRQVRELENLTEQIHLSAYDQEEVHMYKQCIHLLQLLHKERKSVILIPHKKGEYPMKMSIDQGEESYIQESPPITTARRHLGLSVFNFFKMTMPPQEKDLVIVSSFLFLQDLFRSGKMLSSDISSTYITSLFLKIPIEHVQRRFLLAEDLLELKLPANYDTTSLDDSMQTARRILMEKPEDLSANEKGLQEMWRTSPMEFEPGRVIAEFFPDEMIVQ